MKPIERELENAEERAIEMLSELDDSGKLEVLRTAEAIAMRERAKKHAEELNKENARKKKPWWRFF